MDPMHDDTFETTRDRYNDLVTRIEEARAAYYDRDAPTISDADYDRMYRESKRSRSVTRSCCAVPTRPR